MQTQINEPQLLVDSNRGQYIPQAFCQAYKPYITNLEKVQEDFNICLSGPDNDLYWEAWDDLLNKIEFTDDHGGKFTVEYLNDNGDLWAIPEGYEYPED